MEENKGWKIEVTSNDGTKIRWQTEQWDCNATDLLEAMYGILITHTYHPASILRAMKSIVEDNSDILQDDDE